MTSHEQLTESVETIQNGLDQQGYICNPQIATVVYLALQLHKPILVEGPPGVGKTELAKTIADYLRLPLMPCYAAYCHDASECNTLAQLENIVSRLLRLTV